MRCLFTGICVDEVFNYCYLFKGIFVHNVPVYMYLCTLGVCLQICVH